MGKEKKFEFFSGELLAKLIAKLSLWTPGQAFERPKTAILTGPGNIMFLFPKIFRTVVRLRWDDNDKLFNYSTKPTRGEVKIDYVTYL